MMKWTSHTEQDTLIIGRQMAEFLKPGDVLSINGEMGAGKTTLIKGICQHFDIDLPVVTSPTFTIVNEYSGLVSIFHMDFYRVESDKELYQIGIEDYFLLGGIVLIEWADRFSTVLPVTRKTIYIENIHPRIITLEES